MKSAACVPTRLASRYLQQLCKHWGHKFPVDFTPHHGEIELPIGKCTLDAADGTLEVEVIGPDTEEGITKLEQVVQDHIARFAFRERLTFHWRRT